MCGVVYFACYRADRQHVEGAIFSLLSESDDAFKTSVSVGSQGNRWTSLL